MAFGNISKLAKDDLEYHFIYCGNHARFHAKVCTEAVINELKLGSAIFTYIGMVKLHLLTKETMEKYYKDEIEIDSKIIEMYDSVHGPMVNDTEGTHFKESTGEDLESFFMNLQHGKLKRSSRTFFLPKVLPYERKMIEERSIDRLQDYFSSYQHGRKTGLPEYGSTDWMKEYKETLRQGMEKVDVGKLEMELSEPNSKYILCYCARRTVWLPVEYCPKTRKRKYKAI